MKCFISFIFISLIAACPLIFSSCGGNSKPEEPVASDQLATLTVSGHSSPAFKENIESKLLEHGVRAEVDAQKAENNVVIRQNNNISIAEIRKIIVAAGYKVEGEGMIADDQLTETTLTVSGLCGDCKTSLEGKLLDHGMMAEVDIQKAHNNTVVRHKKNISLADITKIIVAAGYNVEN